MNKAYSIGHADYITILIDRKCPQPASEVLQTVLGLVQWWCDRINLSINQSKTVIMFFTKKGLKGQNLFGNTKQLSTEVKYLGLILEKGLTWDAQLGKVTNRACKAF
jgi:hypothetical protein